VLPLCCRGATRSSRHQDGEIAKWGPPGLGLRKPDPPVVREGNGLPSGSPESRWDSCLEGWLLFSSRDSSAERVRLLNHLFQLCSGWKRYLDAGFPNGAPRRLPRERRTLHRSSGLPPYPFQLDAKT